MKKKLMLAGICLAICIQAAQGAQVMQPFRSAMGRASAAPGQVFGGQPALSQEEANLPMKALPYEENQAGLSAEEANLPMKAQPFYGQGQVTGMTPAELRASRGLTPTGSAGGLRGTNRNFPDMRDDFGLPR